MTSPIIRHQILQLELDLAQQQIQGTTKLVVRSPDSGRLRVNYTGGVISCVACGDRVLKHSLVSSAEALAGLSSLSNGLELTFALRTEQAGVDGDLLVEVPSDVDKDEAGFVSLDIAFLTRGSRGPLRFTPCGTAGGLAAFALQRPSASPSTWAAGSLGASAIFPCLDASASPCTWDIQLSLAGSDESGRLPILAPTGAHGTTQAAGQQSLPMLVTASGRPAATGGASSELSSGRDGIRRRVWKFSVEHPVPPSAIGFVAAPLTVAESCTVPVQISHAQQRRLAQAAAAASGSASMGSVEASGSGAHSRQGAGSKRSGSGMGAGGATHTKTLTVEHICSPFLATSGVAALHAKRTRRMLLWLSDLLGLPYPFGHHKHVFLPSECLQSYAATVQAGAGGLLPHTQGAAGGLAPLFGLVEMDVHHMAGLSIYPDTLLTSRRIIDSDASVHRAQAYGIISAIFGAVVTPKGWTDCWLVAGAAGYVTDLYMRSFRGQADWDRSHVSLVEVVAALEEEHPQLVLCLAPHGHMLQRHMQTVLAAHPFRETAVMLKARAVWRIAAGQFGEESMRSVLQSMLSGGDQSSTDRAQVLGGAFSTPDFLRLLKLATSSSLRASSRVHLSDPVDLWAHQWVHGKGVPQLHIGVHVNNALNQVELVVEQVLRPGAARMRPAIPKLDAGQRCYGDTSAELADACFLGPLTIHVVERPEEDSSTVPDTWAHTINITRLRESFILPCHARVHKKPLDRLSALPVMRKPGRPRLERNAAIVEAAVSAAASEIGKSSLGHPDEMNDVSVLRVRIDPACAWLMRVHVQAPPALMLNQLQEDPSPLAQMQALASLSAIGLGSASYTPSGVSGRAEELGNPFPVLGGRLSVPGGTQGNTSPDVTFVTSAIVDAQTALQTAGLLPRPIEAFTPLYRSAAVLLGLNPSFVKLPVSLRSVFSRRFGMGAGDGAGAADSAAQGPQLNRSLVEAPPPANSIKGIIGAPDVVETDWHVCCASALAVARWQCGHLPACGRVFMLQHSWAGLAVLVAVYQCLFYAEPSKKVLLALQYAKDRDSTSLLSSLLDQCCRWDEDTLSQVIAGGTPGPLAATSLEDIALRQALFAAAASIRYADGVTPDLVLSFLTTVVRTYDCRLTAHSYDDTPLLASHIVALGSALAESQGAKLVKATRSKMRDARQGGATSNSSETPGPSSAGTTGTLSSGEEAWNKFIPSSSLTHSVAGQIQCYKRGWLVLREQVALELSSMRYAAQVSGSASAGAQPALATAVQAASVSPALDSATQGQVAAAAISAVCVLESAGVAPVTLTPILRSYLPAVHKGSGQRLPLCVRLAAVVGVSRVILAAGPAHHPGGLLGWLTAFSALLNVVLPGSSNNSVDDGEWSVLRQAALECLYELQRRTDHQQGQRREAVDSDRGDAMDEDDEEDDNEGSGKAQVRKYLLNRLAADLERMQGLDKSDSARLALAEAIRDVGSASQSRTWALPEVAIDLGLFDKYKDKLTLHERRLYGMARYAPAYHGLLTPVAQAAFTAEHGPVVQQVARQALGVLASCAAADTCSPVRLAATALLHSIVGMGPCSTSPVPAAKDAYSFLSSLGLSDSELVAVRAQLHVFSDARRRFIHFLRTSALHTHNAAELTLLRVRDLPGATGNIAVVPESEEQEAEARAEATAAAEAGHDEDELDDEPKNEDAVAATPAVSQPVPHAGVKVRPGVTYDDDDESSYEYSDDDEDRPKKRGRKAKHPGAVAARPHTAQPAAPVVAPLQPGARPKRAASDGIQKVLAAEGSGPQFQDPEARGRGRPPGSGRTQVTADFKRALVGDDTAAPSPYKQARPNPNGSYVAVAHAPANRLPPVPAARPAGTPGPAISLPSKPQVAAPAGGAPAPVMLRFKVNVAGGLGGAGQS